MKSFPSVLFLLIATLWSTSTTAQDAAASFREAILSLANDGLGVQAYQDYINTAAELTYNITNVPGDQLVSQIAKTLQNRLQTHSSLVNNIREVIQKALSSQPTTSSTLTNCCNVESDDSPYDVRFRSQTDTNSMCSLGLTTTSLAPLSSSVLYDMKNSLQQYTSLRWQYFGTENGNMYRYPATVGQTCDQTDYDPRLSQWYKSTISPNAKDVVILIHRSASMASNLPLATDAARLIIDNMNTEDKVALVAFSDQTTAPPSADSCYSRQLSVVNPTTRKEFERFLNSLAVDGSANFANAFKMAFSLLNTSSISTTGGGRRDRAIVLITNGVGLSIGSQQLDTLNVIRDGNKLFKNQVVIFAFAFNDTSIMAMEYLTSITYQASNDATVAETRQTNPQRISPRENFRTAMATFFTAFVQTGESAPVVYTAPYFNSSVGLIMSLCVPVTIRSQLRGVTCVDVTIDTLFSEVQYFQQSSSSYAFLMDGDGRILIHPLLPQLSSSNVDTTLPGLADIEYDPNNNIIGVRQGMLSQTSGNLTFISRTVTPRGDTTRKGVSTAMYQHTYYWHPVTSTSFSVCVVIAENYENSSVVWKSATYPPVYLIDFEPINSVSPQRCTLFSRIVLRNKTSVKLAPQAFLQPSSFRDIDYDDTVHTEWKEFLRGQTTTSTYIKSNIRDAVASTYMTEDIWQQRDTSEFAIWRYIGLREGIFRQMPGTTMSVDYDPTLRPWYQQAVADSNIYTCYGPYTDAGGADCLLTLAKAIRRNATAADDSSRIIGVMGMDFRVSYLRQLLLSKFQNCSGTNVQCFIIDSSGYLIMHPNFLRSSSCDTITLQHITCVEPGVANDMIKRGLLTSDNCINYVNYTQLTFWKVKLTNNPQVSGSYVIYGIDETNMFVIVKYGQFSSATCTCYTSPFTCSFSVSGSSSTQCQSPCFSSTTYSKVCLGQSNFNSSTPPCYPPPPSLKLTNVTAVDAPYISTLCPCQGPVNCSITKITLSTTATTATTIMTMNTSSLFSTVNTGTTTTALDTSPPSSNLLPLLALLTLLIVPVICIWYTLIWCRKKRSSIDYESTESPAYQISHLFHHKKAEENNHYTEIEVRPEVSDRGPSNADNGVYLEIKCESAVDVNLTLANSHIMTENAAYGKSPRITNTLETVQLGQGDLSSNHYGTGRPIHHTVSVVLTSNELYENDITNVALAEGSNEPAIDNEQVMTENPAYGKSVKMLQATNIPNTVGTQNGDVEEKPPTEGSEIALQSSTNPNHGVYLRTNNFRTPEPFVSAPECLAVTPIASQTQLVAVKLLADSESVFDGQSQLTTLERGKWITDDVDLDENHDDSANTSHENGIYMNTNYVSEENLNNTDTDHTYGPNEAESNTPMDERPNGVSGRSGASTMC